MSLSTAALGVIVVAAGSGTRLGAAIPKAYVELGGVTLLERALRPVFTLAEPVQVVLVVPADRVDESSALAARVAGVAQGHVTVVAGGATRQESVAAGLAVLAESVEVVLVHDAARALAPAALFGAVAAAVRETGAGVIPGLPVVDTIKRVDARGHALETVDRSQLAAVQTPQGFPRAQLAAAYAAAVQDYTDDAALAAAAGLVVTVIAGDALAFKVTTPWDLRRAEGLLADAHGGDPREAAAPTRTGIGIDVHAYDDAQPLWLGGLFWPGEVGLAGHSDGDAIAHAVCDALLSAAGLGDIGGRFGTDDPRFAGAHGEVFVTATVELVAAAGFRVQNVAVQVVAAKPKLAPRREEMERTLTALVGAPVSVSATTSDGLGFTGRSEGVAAIATALLGP